MPSPSQGNPQETTGHESRGVLRTVRCFFARLFSGLFAERPLYPEAEVVVTFDASRVVVTWPNASPCCVTWDDLQIVYIETNDHGPYDPDVFFVLIGSFQTSACAFPQGAVGDMALLKRLQELPGFDNGAVVAAMGCTSVARFICWRRDASLTIEGAARQAAAREK